MCKLFSKEAKNKKNALQQTKKKQETVTSQAYF